MTQLAWGAKPPATVPVKYGWLDSADMNLFCEYKELAQKYYGQSSWESFRERVMVKLPEAEKLSRQDLWGKTILSTNCLQFQ